MQRSHEKGRNRLGESSGQQIHQRLSFLAISRSDFTTVKVPSYSIEPEPQRVSSTSKETNEDWKNMTQF